MGTKVKKYRTRDLVEACTYITLGYEIIKTELVVEEGKRRVYFEFTEIGNKLVNEFLSGSLMVEPTAFAAQHIKLKSLIYRAITEERS